MDTNGNNNQKTFHIPDDILTKVESYLKPFVLSQDMLQQISGRLEKDMVHGLGRHSHHKAPVKMLPTFVRATPDGTENGDYLALDLGGTNFRVLYIRVMAENRTVETTGSQTCVIPADMMVGPGEKLFDHIAACLGEFLESQNLKSKILPLGFTFSFPCEQKEIGKSVLIRWTKGFKCNGVEGRDVVELLREAIHRRGDYNIGPVAMVNDTVGTMMSCGYKDPNCEIAMIIGTGTNACYMEEMKNVRRVEGEDGRICINTELGGFGDDGVSLKEIQTPFDVQVDQMSVNTGVHIFEKMISGMYLGEIVRLLLLKMADNKILFGGSSGRLQIPGAFETRFISDIEEPGVGLDNGQKILSGLALKWNMTDVHMVRRICDTVSSRSARLCAAALATIVTRMRLNRGLKHLQTTVGVDGTVYRKHPSFRDDLEETIHLLAPECDITFLISEDGSGKGAAMVTAVMQRLALQTRLLEESDGEEGESD